MAAFTAPRWQLPAPTVLRSRSVWVAAAVVVTFLILISNTHSSITSNTAGAFRRIGDNLYDVQNSTFGFERIFCISLPVRTDQYDEMALVGKATGINIEMMPGVNGEGIPDKVLPQGNPATAHNTKPAIIGTWRAHLNVFQRIVNENIATALILEADVDWDIRIKEQLVQFAKAARILVQPKKGTQNQFLDPTVPYPRSGDIPSNFTIDEHYDLVQKPTDSPYGDTEHWDVLWLGHCGDNFPEAKHNAPLGRVVISGDTSVPQPRWLDMMYGDKNFKTEYPNNTRVVHWLHGTICTFGYAITQRGAQKMLYELGVKKIDGAIDIMVRDACEGVRDHPRLNCLSVQPMLMQSHRPRGPESRFTDIGAQNTRFQEKAYTKNIRYSTKINLPQLLYGWTNFTEQWSDEEPSPR